jgi:DNA-binding HxlR family transcriptional regulator
VKVKRSYDDPCGVARALDAVGERWALLVVRELLYGPKRFSALSGALPGMSQNVLSQRLRELEDAGLVARRTFGPPVSARGYELTERGYDLEPVLLALGRWGSRIPAESAAELSVDALILALQTTFDPAAAAGRRARVELRLGDDCFQAEIASGEFTVTRGVTGPVDATLVTDAGTLRAVVFGGLALAEAEQPGRPGSGERGHPDPGERGHPDPGTQAGHPDPGVQAGRPDPGERGAAGMNVTVSPAGWGDCDIHPAESAPGGGRLRVEGDREVAEWFAGCFPRPVPVAEPGGAG